MFDETLPNIPSHPKYIISTQKGQQNRVTSAMAALLLIEHFCKICTKMIHQNLLLFAARRQNLCRFYLNLFFAKSIHYLSVFFKLYPHAKAMKITIERINGIRVESMNNRITNTARKKIIVNQLVIGYPGILK